MPEYTFYENQLYKHPKLLIETNFSKHFILHSNLHFDPAILQKFPRYYRSILLEWSRSFRKDTIIPSQILSQPLWYNRNILIDHKALCMLEFASKDVNFIADLIDTNDQFKTWENLKTSFTLKENSYFKWLQI